ncbi:uncharacterized protein ISCGN_027250 [Ixodes scapularis]
MRSSRRTSSNAARPRDPFSLASALAASAPPPRRFSVPEGFEELPNENTFTEEDWEPEIVPGRPGYVPLMSRVRPFFREVVDMTPLQRRQYYDELLKQHKVIEMLRAFAGSQECDHTGHPNEDCEHQEGPPNGLVRSSLDELEKWHIEPRPSTSCRPASACGERRPTTEPKYLYCRAQQTRGEEQLEPWSLRDASTCQGQWSQAVNKPVTDLQSWTSGPNAHPEEGRPTTPTLFIDVDPQGEIYYTSGRGRGRINF